jgi:hypothetical protein
LTALEDGPEAVGVQAVAAGAIVHAASDRTRHEMKTRPAALRICTPTFDKPIVTTVWGIQL